MLASNWQLLLIALLVLALLVLIFPRRALVDQLYKHGTLDDLTVSYIQNLYRSDPSNADVGVLLARSQQAQLSIDALESMLLPLLNSIDPSHQAQAQTMLANAYERVLAAGPSAGARAQLRAQFTNLLQRLGQDQLSDPLARRFGTIAFELQLPRLGLELLGKAEYGSLPSTLDQYGRKALSQGQHQMAAAYFLATRDLATDADEARRLFEAGIGAHMAASQFKQAMAAAQQHLGNLANDPQTLRYLTRTALAAGEPELANRYAKALVFRSNNANLTP